MKDNNSTKDRSWIKRIIQIPGLNRIAAIKNLFLEKFDLLNSKADILHEKLDLLNGKADILLDNNSPLIVGTTKLVEVAENFSKNLERISQQNNALEQRVSNIVAQNQDLQRKIKVIQDKNYIFQSSLDEIVEKNHTFQSSLDEIIEKNHTFHSGLNEVEQTLSDINHNLTREKESSQFIVVRGNDNVDPDTRLMAYLYSFLPNHKAIDIGANKGDVSFELVKAGYEVYAFEPFPETFNRLSNRFKSVNQIHCFQIALGATDEVKELFIANDQSPDQRYKDSTFYNSLVKHSTPDDIPFVGSIPVKVRSLKSLHENNVIPNDIDLVKIDTEGYDLEVLKGINNHAYPVVITEFWDKSFPFGRANAYNYLSEMATEMNTRGYNWFIIIYRVWGSDDISFYCNNTESIENSWGNVFFFHDYNIFTKAMQWCSSVLRSTYFL